MATPLQRLSSTYLVEQAWCSAMPARAGVTLWVALQTSSGLFFQAVLGEQSKVVCLRFGQDFSPECMKMDEVQFVPCRYRT